MASIRTQVLERLARGPQTQSEILAAIPEIESPKQLANCLNVLRRSGLVTRRDDKRYERSAVGDNVYAAKLKRQTMLAALGCIPPAPAPQEPPAHNVRAILEKAIADNQAALDDYLAAVADPRIYGPLRAARDSARAALNALGAGADAGE